MKAPTSLQLHTSTHGGHKHMGRSLPLHGGSSPTQPTHRDPVCGMDVRPESAAGRHEHGGTTYHFCSEHCLERFRSDPRAFVQPATPVTPVTDPREYTCPMHPEIVQRGPGACPICGMALEPKTVAAGEDANPELEDMSRRFWISLVLTLPVFAVAMGEMIPVDALRHALAAPWLKWVQLALATPVVAWAGWPLLARFWASLATRNLNMFTLIGLGTLTAYGFSIVGALVPDVFPASFRGHGGAVPLYFESAAVITTLVLLGQVLELRARSRTSQAIRSLLELAPKQARLVKDDGSEIDIALETVKVRDRLRVRPGEKVPVDGVIVEGSTAIDESMVSGEAIPVDRGIGDRVTGGTVNTIGAFVMRAERVGSDTYLAQVVKLVSDAQRSRASVQRVADRVAAYFVPAVLAVAVIAFAAWALLGPPPALSHALLSAISVVIIACPCALGLATPMSIMVGVGRGATAGILIKNAEALELLEKVDTLVVDKTGTLTEGKPRLTAVVRAAGATEQEIVRLAASLERASEHPLATAVIAGARERRIDPEPIADFRSHTGRGVTGRVGDRELALGDRRLLEGLGIDAQPLADEAEMLRERGGTVLFLASNKKLMGLLALSDRVKASTPDALAALRAEGVRVVMVTGDNPTTARAVAQELGIDAFEGGVLPDGKAAVVKRLQGEGRFVAMAGDGINDAPALAQANVGIAMGHGTDVAIESAGITLVQGDLRAIARARRLSRATMKNIRQNLFLAFVYNSLGVPVAAGVLYPLIGLLLSPMIASAAMSLSSVSVIANALRLRTARL